MPSLDLYVGSKTDAEISAALPLCVRCGRRHFASYHHSGQCSYQFEDGTFCPEDALRLDGRGRYDPNGKKFAAHCAAHRLSRSEQDPYEEAQERNREYEANERERMRQLRSFNAKEASRPLALQLGQGVRKEGKTFYVSSRTRPGRDHKIDIAVDGSPVCDCEADAHGRECWAIKLVREEQKMSESTALVPIRVNVPAATLPSERELSLIDQAAAMAFKGAVALPKELNTPQKVAAVMLYGWELGLKPMTAIRHVFIVEGRPQPSAEVMAGMFEANEPKGRLIVESLTDTECTMRIVRPNRGINESYTVTWADVVKAGLDRKDVWAKYPKDKLRWHCTKRILRIYAPDAINGLRESPAYEVGDEPDHTDAIDPREFWNEGDEQQNVEGAAQEGPGPQTLAQVADTKAAIIALLTELKESFPEDEFALVRGTIRTEWPETETSRGFDPKKVADDHADDLLAYLEECRRVSSAQVPLGLA